MVALTFGAWIVWRLFVLPHGGDQKLEVADLFVYFLPAYRFEAARLRDGALPFWNPYQAVGVPFLAMLQPGALYPARLLLLVTDAPRAMGLATFGHLVLVLLATFLLCRTLGVGRVAAAAGAAVYAATFGRAMLFSPPFLEAGAWLPVAALALERLIVDGRWRWVVLLGVSGAMPVLAGGGQAAVYVAYGLAIFALALLRRRGHPRRLPAGTLALRLSLAAVVALGLAAPQLLPTVAWTLGSARDTAALTDIRVDPYFWVTWRMRLVSELGTLSVPVLVLALVGYATEGVFGAVLGVAATAATLLSVGPGTPWFGVYRMLPGLGMFRFPTRLFTTVVTFLAALGVALGVSAIGRIAGARGRPVSCVVLALLLVVLVPKMRNDGVLPWATTDAHILRGMATLFTFLSAADAGERIVLGGEPRDWGVTARLGMAYRVRTVGDYEPLSARRLGEYLAAVQGVPWVPDDPYRPFVGWSWFDERMARPALLDLLAVRQLVLPDRVQPPARTPAFVRRETFGPYVVWQNPLALPRAYLVERARLVGDALAAVTDPGFDGQREAVVTGGTVALPDGPAAPARPARIVEDAPERVAVEFATDRPALLVLADGFAPGWQVTVDDAPRAVLQVNHVVRGVVVRPGEHRATFTYRAPGFAPGVVAAAAAIALVAYSAAVSLRRARG